jgi:hypothetical protein
VLLVDEPSVAYRHYLFPRVFLTEIKPMAGGGSTQTDPIIARLVAEDTVPWYQKRNLRLLYLIMFPTCIGIEMTSGSDGL